MAEEEEELVTDRTFERKAELERLAGRLVVHGGLSGLSIDRLAQEAGCSRPTIYRHFKSKEDALAAVVANTLKVGEEIFADIDKPITGSGREQAMVVFIAMEQMARFHPDAFQVADMLANAWMREVIEEDTQWLWVEVVTSYFRELERVIEEARMAGELSFADDDDAGKIVFHSVAMVTGIYMAALKDYVSYQLAGIRDPWKHARRVLNFYWDGLGWGPLSKDADYEASYDRILKERFPRYWIQVKKESLEKEVGVSGSVSRSRDGLV